MSPRHCSFRPQSVPVGRGIARLAMTVAMAVTLSGCSGFFESLASFFGGEVEQTGPMMARNTEAPLSVPRPTQEEFCYREARYLDMGPDECLHFGGRPVIVRGGLEALRNRTLGRPDAAPVPEVETVGTIAPNGRVAEAGASPVRAAVRDRNGGGEWSGRPAAADLSGVRPTVAELRPAPMPRGDTTGRRGQCYREYRYLNLSPDDCRRHGGVIVDDSFSPGPQPLHKIQPTVAPREEAAIRPEAAASTGRTEAGYRGEETAGHAAQHSDDPTLRQVAVRPVNASYTLHRDVWRCRLGKQLLRLDTDACAAARGNMVRGDVLEDMYGIARPADEDRTSHIVLTPSVQMARAVRSTGVSAAGEDGSSPSAAGSAGSDAGSEPPGAAPVAQQDPVQSIFVEPPAPDITDQGEVEPVTRSTIDPITSVANGPKSGLPAPATLPADGPRYRADDDTAVVAPGGSLVGDTARVDGSDPLWPGPDMRLANRGTADRWDAVVPTMASDHAGQRRLFCYRDGQYLTLSSDDCDVAGGILTVGRPDPFTGPIAPASGPVVESGPLVTPARLSSLVAQRD